MNVIDVYFGIAIRGVVALFTDAVDTYKKLIPKQYDKRRSIIYVLCIIAHFRSLISIIDEA